MLTLLPPLVVTVHPKIYNEELHDTNQATWDESIAADSGRNRKLVYYRPILVYGNQLSVAVKGLVGNVEQQCREQQKEQLQQQVMQQPQQQYLMPQQQRPQQHQLWQFQQQRHWYQQQQRMPPASKPLHMAHVKFSFCIAASYYERYERHDSQSNHHLVMFQRCFFRS